MLYQMNRTLTRIASITGASITGAMGYKDRGLCRVSLGNGIIRFIDLDNKYKTLDDMLKII